MNIIKTHLKRCLNIALKYKLYADVTVASIISCRQFNYQTICIYFLFIWFDI